jgi:hypothetical protein
MSIKRAGTGLLLPQSDGSWEDRGTPTGQACTVALQSATNEPILVRCDGVARDKQGIRSVYVATTVDTAVLRPDPVVSAIAISKELCGYVPVRNTSGV